MAFISFVAFLNSLVGFFAGLIGFPEVNFEALLGYAFVPVALIMGIDPSECHTVGTLIGESIYISGEGGRMGNTRPS